MQALPMTITPVQARSDILERIDLRLLYGTPYGDQPLFINCPSHGDNGRPNCAVYRRNVNCFRCGFHEGAFDHIRRAKGVTSMATVLAVAEELCTSGPHQAPPPAEAIDPSVVSVFQNALERVPERIKYLTDRYGLTPHCIERARIGLSPRAYTIPVYDVCNNLVNIRYRLLPEVESPDGRKYFGTKGHNGFAWYLPYNFPRTEDAADLSWAELLHRKYGRSSLVLTEGEWDALALAQMNIVAISGTNGADTWQKIIKEHLEDFAGCSVYVMYDQDEAGMSAGKALTEALQGCGVKAKYVWWPPSAGKDPSELVANGWTREDFRKLVLRT